MERRLAAILAADVVGYSRLIREDEAGTLERLKTHETGYHKIVLRGRLTAVRKTLSEVSV
jgi:adenylate cyclase